MSTTTIDRTAWLAERNTGIGSSDSPAILGVSEFKSPFQLWCEKTGVADPEDLDGVERIEWGNRLQEPVADAFGDRTGRDLTLWDQSKIVRDGQYPWLLATPDAIQEDVNREGKGLLEIKTTSAFNAGDWRDEPPLAYQVQLNHAMRVTGLEWGTLAVLIGGQKLVWFDMERNDAFLAAMLPRLEDFWSCVVEKRQPEIDGSMATAKLLARLHPDDNGATVELPEAADVWLADLEAAKAAVKAAEEAKTLAENRLKAAIGSATFACTPGGKFLSYKTQRREEYVCKASEFRVLRQLAKRPK